jgi:hypothetical protein
MDSYKEIIAADSRGQDARKRATAFFELFSTEKQGQRTCARREFRITAPV